MLLTGRVSQWRCTWVNVRGSAPLRSRLGWQAKVGILGTVFHFIEKKISDRVSELVQVQFALEQPKQASFGELAIPVAFHLARQLKRRLKSLPPRLWLRLGPIEGVSALEVAGNGYINVRLDRGAYGLGVLRGAGESR